MIHKRGSGKGVTWEGRSEEKWPAAAARLERGVLLERGEIAGVGSDRLLV